MSLTNTKRTSWTLILDPLAETIDILSVLSNNGKSLRSPSIYSSILSRTSRVPKDQPLNLSVATSSMVIWNSLYNDVVGMERHGSLSIGNDIEKLFEDIETLEYYIDIYLKSKNEF